MKYEELTKYRIYKTEHLPLQTMYPELMQGFPLYLNLNFPFASMVKGVLTLKPGFCWDGPSGPAMDTPNAMTASGGHDALYWMIREGYLDIDIYRPLADVAYKHWCIWKGMSRFRAGYHYWGVRKFARFAAKLGTQQVEILEAP